MGRDGGKAREYDLEERLIDFGVRIMNAVEALPRTRVGNHVADHLLRSGTSPAFHYGEAESAESRNDFIHKMKVCLKELREARIALLMAQRKRLLPPRKTTDILAECEELVRIFSSSIRTAQANRTDGRRPQGN